MRPILCRRLSTGPPAAYADPCAAAHSRTLPGRTGHRTEPEEGKKGFNCACYELRALAGVKSMRNLMLATASAIVLGVAGAGIGHAAEQYSSPTNTPGSAMQMPSTMTASELLIMAAQQQLKYSGLYNGSVDGKMSSETQRAFRQFQQQHGLPQSGTLDERTYTALQGDQGDTGQVGSGLVPGRQ